MRRYRYTQSKRGKRPDWFQDLVTTNDIVTYDSFCLLLQKSGSYIRCELGDFVVLNDDGSLTTEMGKIEK